MVLQVPVTCTLSDGTDSVTIPAVIGRDDWVETVVDDYGNSAIVAHYSKVVLLTGDINLIQGNVLGDPMPLVYVMLLDNSFVCLALPISAEITAKGTPVMRCPVIAIEGTNKVILQQTKEVCDD